MHNQIMNCRPQTGEELRPYEKCDLFGPESLSDAELIAVIIRSGSPGKSAVRLAEELLSLNCGEEKVSLKDSAGRKYRSFGLARLLGMDLTELRKHKGIGRVKSLQLICLFELSKRIAREQILLGADISTPAAAAAYYMDELRLKSEEEVHLMLLNTKNRMMASVMVSKGSVSSSAISPREIFIEALRFRAAAMIVVHNHPSGNPSPSKDDIQISRDLRKLGQIMNIPLLDSIIIGDHDYYSFTEEGKF